MAFWNRVVVLKLHYKAIWTSCLISGIPPRFKTKSAYMKYNCAMRMRNYMTVKLLFILLLNPETICGMHIIITSCSCVCDLRWLKIPKPTWKTKSGKSFWQHQSFWRTNWRKRSTTATTLTGRIRSRIASALRKDGLAARYFRKKSTWQIGVTATSVDWTREQFLHSPNELRLRQKPFDQNHMLQLSTSL